MGKHGLSDEDRPEISYGLLQVRIKMLEARLRRLRGEDDGYAELVANGSASLRLLSAAAETQTQTEIAPSPFFSEFATSYAEYAKTAKDNRGHATPVRWCCARGRGELSYVATQEGQVWKSDHCCAKPNNNNCGLYCSFEVDQRYVPGGDRCRDGTIICNGPSG